VLSDTHLRQGRLALPTAVLQAAESADLILHAGDVMCAEALDLLAAIAPVHAVLGNNDEHDRALVERLPPTLAVHLDGVAVALVHDSGASAGRPARLARWFPSADLVVFGHSHQPYDERDAAGRRYFNPGSPTVRRRAPTHSYGWLECRDGEVARLELVELA